MAVFLGLKSPMWSLDLSSLGRTAVVVIVLCVGSLFEGVVLYNIVSPPFLLILF